MVEAEEAVEGVADWGEGVAGLTGQGGSACGFGAAVVDSAVWGSGACGRGALEGGAWLWRTTNGVSRRLARTRSALRRREAAKAIFL